MRLFDIMNSSVRVTSSQVSAARAAASMKRDGIHHLVVMDGKQIAGVVSDRDLGGRQGRVSLEGTTVADWMSPQAITADAHMSVRQAANLLRGRSIGCLPVTDGKKLVGIITATDLLELIGRGGNRGERALTTRAGRRYQPPRWSA